MSTCCMKTVFPLTNSLHHRLITVRLLFSAGNIKNQRERQPTHRSKQDAVIKEAEEFRRYEIAGLKNNERTERRTSRKMQVMAPRYKSMLPDQDWTNVWPSASTFKWSTVPFPVRQGYVDNQSENEGIIPGRYANAELLKIPNFLHLTPAHIKKQCKAIKGFCSTWPEGLDTDEKCDEHFPVTVETRDYCFSGPSVRDPRARLVTVKVKLSDLKLDYHGEDKIKRLLGDKYNPHTDEIVLNTDRCPLKKQNYDYAIYLLTALYHESKKVEPWESEKSLEDMEKYFWHLNPSKDNLLKLLHRIQESDKKFDNSGDKSFLPEEMTEENLLKLPQVVNYSEAVTELHNEGENHTTITNYKNTVLELLYNNCPQS